MMPPDTMTCPSRMTQVGSWERKEGIDSWTVRPNGDRTCSFCGSLHEDDFVAIIEAYGNGEPGYRFDPSTKGYKRYANRPGVSNATEGGIKFYGWHIDKTPGPDLDRRSAIFDRAMDRWRSDMAAR